jgi:formyl-CoA transferase
MLEATLAAMGWPVSNYLIAGEAPVPMGNDNATASPSGAFRCSDGLLNIAANKQEQYEALCRVLGREELIADPRFAGREARKRNRRALAAELEVILQQQAAVHWEGELNRAGVPAGRVLSVPQALALAQVRERQLLRRFAPVAGVDREVTVLRAGFRLAEGDPGPAVPPPRLGEHTDEVLQQIGYDAEEIERLRSEGVL